MKIKIIKKIKCGCATGEMNPVLKIQQAIEKLYSDLKLETKQQNGHLSCICPIDPKDNHTIWIFAYDEKGIAESEKNGETVTRAKDNLGKPLKTTKYDGKKLNKKDIEAELEKLI